MAPGTFFWLAAKGYLDNGFPATAVARDGITNSVDTLKARVDIEVPQPEPYQFFDDFTGLPAVDLNTVGTDYTIVENGDFNWTVKAGGVAPDGQYLNCERTVLTASAKNWATITTNPRGRDLEIVALVRLGDAQWTSLYGPVLMNETDEACYVVRRISTDTYEVRKMGATWATLTPVSNSFTFTETDAEDWHWIRIGNTGKEIHARMWAYGEPEPTEWMGVLEEDGYKYLRPALTGYDYRMEPFDIDRWGFGYDASAPMSVEEIEETKEEPVITFRKPWTKQPPADVGIDSANAITRGLRWITLAGQDYSRELIKGYAPDSFWQTGAVHRACRYGPALEHDIGSVGYAQYQNGTQGDSRLPAGSSGATWLLWATYNLDQGVSNGPIFSNSGGGPITTGQFSTARNQNDAFTAELNTTVSNYTAGSSVGDRTILKGDGILAMSGGVWANDELICIVNDFRSAPTATSGTIYDMASNRYAYLGWIQDQDHVSHILMAAIWDRALSEGELQSLQTNPWQIFKPETVMVPAGDAVRRRLVTF